MRFRYDIYVPLVVGAIAASGAVPPHSAHVVRAVPDNFATLSHNVLRARQDDPADAETADCKDPQKELIWCFMCGGKGDDGKCKGNINPPALNRPDYPAHQKAIKEHGSLENDTPAPGPTEPVKQNRPLDVLADWKKDPQSLEDFSKINWLFFATDVGTEVGCRQDWLTSREDTVDILHDADHTFYPGGTFELQMPGFDEKCEYKNDGGSTGRLFCPGQVIPCVDDPHDKNPSDPNADKGNYTTG